MRNYLNTLLEEKGIDQEFILEVTNENGLNLIPVGAVVEYIVDMPSDIQEAVKKVIVQIDFNNGNVLTFFKDLASMLVNQ